MINKHRLLILNYLIRRLNLKVHVAINAQNAFVLLLYDTVNYLKKSTKLHIKSRKP